MRRLTDLTEVFVLDWIVKLYENRNVLGGFIVFILFIALPLIAARVTKDRHGSD